MNNHNISDIDEEVREYTIEEAIKEAKRCLNCKKPSCVEGCPIRNDIPEFIVALMEGNIGEAYKIISAKSNLPAVCGRVCAHELQCEGHCVLNKKNAPVRVGRLERFIADFAYILDINTAKLLPKTRGKVAVIGSGPAGLTVAGDLARMGFNVSVFESLPEPGGVLQYGIPAFRLPKQIVKREISQIEALGVNFVTNRMAGKDFTVDDLFAMEFDAVFIGSGSNVSKDLDLPGKNLDGVMQSSYFLRMITLFTGQLVKREEVPLKSRDKVLVIGGGNTAMDAARTAMRHGAGSVTIVFRRGREDLSALNAEYDGAVEDGVEFLWNANSLSYEGENGKLTGLRVETSEGQRVLPADRIFLAVGSRPANRIVSTTEGIEVDKDGYVINRERPYGMTTRRGVFAGGDVVHRPATVVLAMKEAKKIAEGIAAYVDAVKLLGAE